MEAIAYLVDTDILIDISKGIEAAMQYVENLPGEVFVSAITEMELIVGARNKKEIKEIEEFINNYKTISLDTAVTKEAYFLLKEHAQTHGLTIPDALIAATAKSKNLKIATRNARHFKPIKNLSIEEARYGQQTNI